MHAEHVGLPDLDFIQELGEIVATKKEGIYHKHNIK
jgi:hypothetical protein